MPEPTRLRASERTIHLKQFAEMRTFDAFAFQPEGYEAYLARRLEGLELRLASVFIVLEVASGMIELRRPMCRRQKT